MLQWKSRKQYDLQDIKNEYENPVLPLSYSENNLFPCRCYLFPVDVR